jgi:type IV pilus assembly protein PilA
MNTTKNRLIQKLLLNKKGKKQNGFTLIELMVVVAIVGVLSAVGLPELTKAQDRAKDTAAISELTNAAKECSLNLILDPDTAQTDFAATRAGVAAEADGSGGTPAKFAEVQGNCALNQELTLTSKSSAAGTATVQFVGGIPGTVTITTG